MGHSGFWCRRTAADVDQPYGRHEDAVVGEVGRCQAIEALEDCIRHAYATLFIDVKKRFFTFFKNFGHVFTFLTCSYIPNVFCFFFKKRWQSSERHAD